MVFDGDTNWALSTPHYPFELMGTRSLCGAFNGRADLHWGHGAGEAPRQYPGLQYQVTERDLLDTAGKASLIRVTLSSWKWEIQLVCGWSLLSSWTQVKHVQFTMRPVKKHTTIWHLIMRYCFVIQLHWTSSGSLRLAVFATNRAIKMSKVDEPSGKIKQTFVLVLFHSRQNRFDNTDCLCKLFYPVVTAFNKARTTFSPKEYHLGFWYACGLCRRMQGLQLLL